MQNIHAGFSVNAIDFNPLKPALLASGGKEVYIQDISKSVHSPTSLIIMRGILWHLYHGIELFLTFWQVQAMMVQ